MASFVLDASATLAWCFRDEATSWSDALLNRLRSGDDAYVPAHWPVEVSNAFLSALRRKRVQDDGIRGYWDDLAQLPIAVEAALSPTEAKAVLDLAITSNLTVYDAVYLALAMRLNIPLATLDGTLRQVAPTKGVVLI